MKPYLSQTQRIVVALIYLVLLVVLFKLIGGSFSTLIWNLSLDQTIWFYAGAFMIILGTYVVEPFFTKPSDAVANSTAVLVALLGLNEKSAFWGYSFVFWYSASVLSLSILAIALKDMRGPVFRRIARTAYWSVETCGASKVIFSLVYLLAAYSYLSDRLPAFIGVIVFWICIVFFDLVGIAVGQVSKLVRYWSHRAGDELGQAIGCDNPLLYNIEIDFLKHRPKAVDYGTLVAVETNPNVGSIGMVVNRRVLLNKQWLRIYLLQDEDQEILKIDLRQRKLIIAPKTIFTTANLVFALDPAELPPETKAKVESHPLYRDRELFVGCVGHDSNINTVTFSILRDENMPARRITEGVILKTPIYGDETLYQVINGNTKQERLENLDTHGFTVGIARKLGRYNQGSEELNTVKWMPNIYAPLFFAFSGRVPATNGLKPVTKFGREGSSRTMDRRSPARPTP